MTPSGSATTAPNTSGGLTKLGAGTLILSGLNTYTGNTTVNAGTLVLQQPTLAASSLVAVGAGAHLQLGFAGATNLVSGLLLNGVSQPARVYNSSTPGGYLTGPGSLQVALPSALANLVFTVLGDALQLSCPAAYQGWLLQSDSIDLGAATDWFAVPGSGSTNQMNLNIIPSQQNVFFRLVHP